MTAVLVKTKVIVRLGSSGDDCLANNGIKPSCKTNCEEVENQISLEKSTNSYLGVHWKRIMNFKKLTGPTGCFVTLVILQLSCLPVLPPALIPGVENSSS